MRPLLGGDPVDERDERREEGEAVRLREALRLRRRPRTVPSAARRSCCRRRRVRRAGSARRRRQRSPLRTASRTAAGSDERSSSGMIPPSMRATLTTVRGVHVFPRELLAGALREPSAVRAEAAEDERDVAWRRGPGGAGGRGGTGRAPRGARGGGGAWRRPADGAVVRADAAKEVTFCGTPSSSTVTSSGPQVGDHASPSCPARRCPARPPRRRQGSAAWSARGAAPARPGACGRRAAACAPAGRASGPAPASARAPAEDREDQYASACCLLGRDIPRLIPLFPATPQRIRLGLAPRARVPGSAQGREAGRDVVDGAHRLAPAAAWLFDDHREREPLAARAS